MGSQHAIHHTGDRLRELGSSGRMLLATALAGAFAYTGALWLVLLQVVGGTDRSALPLALHWMRDATFAMPVVVPAVWLAVCGAAALLRRADDAPVRLERLWVAFSSSFAGAVALGLAVPLRSVVFADAGTGPVAVAGLRDALVALAVTLPVGVLVARATLPLRTAAQYRALARRGGLVAIALGAALAAGSAGVSAEASGAGVCPSSAPVKTFDIQAIDVNIPLNGFGDHDPNGRMYVLTAVDGTPTGQLEKVRAEEASQKVSIGLREDAIQPLAIRANMGDCVVVHFTNAATTGDKMANLSQPATYGVHIDGLQFAVGSSGDALGINPASGVATGGAAQTYTYYIPNSPTLEGSHYVHPGIGNRYAVSHGLGGTLTVEPPGSTYLSPNTDLPLVNGWEAMIVPAKGAAFREYVTAFGEVGGEKDLVYDKNNKPLPTVDPLTESYRPGSRTINYRSEPFMRRLAANPDEDALGYSSYAFGDPTTIWPRGYLGDPTKFRLVHIGSELFHVQHLHGGGDRWRFNPLADPTFSYADTGLNKAPVNLSGSNRLDSQEIGPGESYNMEIEGGAGGVQQAAGEFLFHCHIAKHYISGMWGFWRVYDTAQKDAAGNWVLQPLPDRTAPHVAGDPKTLPPDPVTSDKLIGKTIDGTRITRSNLDSWIRPQLPAQGVPNGIEDASVWNWKIDTADPQKPVYLGEPEDPGTAHPGWPDLVQGVAGHFGSYPNDTFVGNRPRILFNPDNGRPAFPLMRTHVGHRPPFSGSGHTGTPWLGPSIGMPQTNPMGMAYAMRTDGLCPNGAPLRTFNVVAISTPAQVTEKAGVAGQDLGATIFVLAQDKEDVLAGRKPVVPLAIRANVGDCVAVTLTSELKDSDAYNLFSKVNMHIHHVQFDTQASDGVISGMSYEQSVRPYKLEDSQLTVPAVAGDDILHLTSVAKFHVGSYIAVGQGTEGIEIHQISSIDAVASTVALGNPYTGAADPLVSDHAANEWAGVEFTQYRWYPDVQLDNIFWHDHVDGIHGWRHGAVGQLVIEPKGSTYTDPQTGQPIRSGPIADIHTNNTLAEGLVKGDFRELVLWTIDDTPIGPLSGVNTGAPGAPPVEGAPVVDTLNLRAAPIADRLAINPDASLAYSSYAHGDPPTPLLQAYPGDPLVIRTINVSGNVDTLHIEGMPFANETRYLDSSGQPEGTPVDTIHYGVSERYTIVARGGAGGPDHKPGDYIYMNGINTRFRNGAWGIIRVLDGSSGGLQPLNGYAAPASAADQPVQTGGRPPATTDPGNPCPADAVQKTFDISAVDVKGNNALGAGKVRKAYVPSELAAAVQNGTLLPEPLVLHVAVGDCLTVNFSNPSKDRASMHIDKLEHTAGSEGINIGWNAEQTVPPGGSRVYRWYVQDWQVRSAMISDFGGNDTGTQGLYGAVEVAKRGATFTSPFTGAPVSFGTMVDVHQPNEPDYRDFTLLFSDINDFAFGQSAMPYPPFLNGQAMINYRAAGTNIQSLALGDTGSVFSQTPATPLLQSYAGDPVVVHAIGAAGSEQVHSFNLGGMSWSLDPNLSMSQTVSTEALGPWEALDAYVHYGAGSGQPGDYFYGDLRRGFTQAGMWGLQRVYAQPTAADLVCPIKPLEGRPCGAPLTPPTVTIDGAPASPSMSSSPAFSFSSPSPKVTYQCSLSAGSDTWQPCTPPQVTYSNVADGTYTFKVVAANPDGVSEAATAQVVVDTVAPATTITNGPTDPTQDPSPAFQFRTGEDGSMFACSLVLSGSPDAFAPCTSAFQPASPLADGTYTFKVRATDGAGNVGAPAVQSFTLNRGPVGTVTVNGPMQTLDSSKPLGTVQIPVKLTWSASSSSGAAISSYVLEQNANGGSGWVKVPVTATATSVTRMLNPGVTYRFRVTATDANGKTGTTTGPSFTPGVVNESGTSVNYGGVWKGATLASAYGGALKFASARNASATYTFTGSSVAFVSDRGPARGRAEVWLDGVKVATVDLFAGTAQPRRMVYAASGLGAPPSGGSHTLIVKLLGTHSGGTSNRVDIDAFVSLSP
jgi:manganese oxidase